MSDLAEEILKLGEKRGKKIGEQTRAQEIALKLLKKGGMAPEEIAEITGLPLETVLSLKQ